MKKKQVKCLTVYQALKTCDKEKLQEEIFNTYNGDITSMDSVKATQTFIDEALKTTPVRNNHRCFIYPVNRYEYDDIEDTFNPAFSVSMMEMSPKISDALLPILRGSSDLHYLLRRDLDALRSMDSLVLKTESLIPIPYALNCDEVKRVLGYYIVPSFIQEFGLEKVLAAVLYEMTFFGYSLDANEEQQSEIVNSADSNVKKIDEFINAMDEVIEQKEEKRKETAPYALDKSAEISVILSMSENIHSFNLLLQDYWDWVNS